MVMDGFDRVHDVAYKYVSRQDLDSWATRRSSSTVSVYDIREGAEALREALVKRRPAGTYGVSYDPAVRIGGR